MHLGLFQASKDGRLLFLCARAVARTGTGTPAATQRRDQFRTERTVGSGRRGETGIARMLDAMDNGGLAVMAVGGIGRLSFQSRIVTHARTRTSGLGVLGVGMAAAVILGLQGRRVQGRMVWSSSSDGGWFATMYGRGRRASGGQTFGRRGEGIMQRGGRRISSSIRIGFVGNEGHRIGGLAGTRFEKRM